MAGLDWGSVPLWVATLAGSVSAVVAADSYRRSVRDKEREQASRVSSWISQVGSFRQEGLRATPYTPPKILLVTVRVANRSDAPIYDVHVTLSWHPTVLTIAEIPAGEVAVAMVEMDLSEHPGRLERLGVEWFDITFDWIATLDEPEVRFTDALGRRWSRGSDHRLHASRASGSEVKASLGFSIFSGQPVEAPTPIDPPGGE